MSNRRNFIKTGVIGAVSLNLLPAINSFANEARPVRHANAEKFKLRFAIASDGHYAQPDTDSDKFYGDRLNG
ncbi:hypothetical protein [Mucilaginibacter humi]|uniref:hypothetical protein n=1 Tax=Mucilaginibacter humi TaxID=2732510 RepID=UPI001FE6F5AE|nr:hypothetical protein [Mucilaginibacter humi]